MIRRTAMEKKQKKIAPKTVELRIRIAPLHPEPIDDEYWQFYCSFPKQGSPDMQIVAKTAERAKDILETFLYSEFDGYGDLEDK